MLRPACRGVVRLSRMERQRLKLMFVVGGVVAGNRSPAEFAAHFAVEMTMGRDLCGQLGGWRMGAGVMVGGAMGENDDNRRDDQRNDSCQRDHPTRDVPRPA